MVSEQVRVRVIDRFGAGDTSATFPIQAHPVISLSTGILSLTGNTSATINVTNGCEGVLPAVSASHNASWLTVTHGGSGNTQTLLCSVSDQGLTPGLYTATVMVTGATVRHKTLDVRFYAGGMVPIAISYPEGGETFNVGQTINVQWTATEDVPQVLVEYQINGSGEWIGLPGSPVRDRDNTWGNLPWLLGAQTAGTSVRVRVHDPKWGVADTSATFAILSGPGINLPVTSLQFQGSDIDTILVTNSGSGTLPELSASMNPAVAWLDVSRYGTGNDQLFVFSTFAEGLSDGLYTTTVTISGQGVSSKSLTVGMTVGTSSKPVAITSPVQADTFTTADTVWIRWTAQSGVQSAQVQYQTAMPNGPWVFITSMPNAHQQWGNYPWVPDMGPVPVMRVRVLNSPTVGDTSGVFTIIQESGGGTPANLVVNGDFSSGTNNWNLQAFENADAQGSVDERGYVIDIASGGTETWHVQLLQAGLTINEGYSYRFEFTAHADGDRTIEAGIGMNSSPFSSYFAQVVTLGTRSNTFSFDFTMNSSTDTDARVYFNCGSGFNLNVFIESVTLVVTDGSGNPPPPIVVISPTAGQSYPVGSQMPISWNIAEQYRSQGLVLGFSTDDGVSWSNIMDRTVVTGDNPGVYLWTIPEQMSDGRPTVSGTCRVRVTMFMDANVYGVSGMFSVIQSGQTGPSIQLSTAHLAFTADSSASVTVTNGGGGTLPALSATVQYDASSGNGWLAVSVDNTPANGALINNTATIAGLADGFHTATVTVTGSGVQNASYSVGLHKTSTPVPPQHFVFTSNTGSNMTVSIPLSSAPTVQGVALVSGDEIGVFTPAGLCVGAVVWDGVNNKGLVVWGDDNQTPGIDGMLPGEMLQYRIWVTAQGTEHMAVASYSSGNALFQPNTMAVLASLRDGTTRQFPVSAGWNMVSFNLQAPDMRAMTVFGGISGFVLAKNNMGQVYWPGQGIDMIGTVSNLEGYQVYTTAPGQIALTGDVVAVSTPLSVASGWNIISYLPAVSGAPSVALETIADQITLVKNNNGEVYFPAWNIDNIGAMLPGQGYQIHMKTNATLTYPGSLARRRDREMIAMSRPVHFTPPRPTGASATLLARDIALAGGMVPDGSEIGVYGADGVLVGAGRVVNGFAAFSIWGRDALGGSEIGAREGEQLLFVLWDGDVETPLEFSAEPVYGSGKILIGSLYASGQGSVQQFAMGVSAMARGQTRISFAVPHTDGMAAQRVIVSIFDLSGRRIATPVSGLFAPGRYSLTWDGTGAGGRSLSSRAYIVEMRSEGFVKRSYMTRIR